MEPTHTRSTVPSFTRLVLNTGYCVFLGICLQVWSFGLYSQAMRFQMGYGVFTNNLLYTLNIAGITVGKLASGSMTRCTGVRITFLLSGLLSSGGMFAVALALDAFYVCPGILMSFWFLLWGIGQGFMLMTLLAVNLRNWEPQHRGKISGVTYGVDLFSNVLNALIYDNFFVEDPFDYSANGQNVSGYFKFCSALTGILCFFAALVIRIWDVDASDKSRGVVQFADTRQVIISVWSIAKTPFFISHLILQFLLAGTERAYVGDIGKIGQSLHLDQIVSNHVIVNGGFNIVSRLGGGFLLDYYRYKIPGWIWLEACSIVLLLNFIFLIVWTETIFKLYIGTAMVSLSGFFYVVQTTVIANTYGAAKMADLWGTAQTLGTTGIFMNVFWNSRLYSSNVKPPSNDNEVSGVCYGTECYFIPFFIAVFQIILSMLITLIVGRDIVPKRNFENVETFNFEDVQSSKSINRIQNPVRR